MKRAPVHLPPVLIGSFFLIGTVLSYLTDAPVTSMLALGSLSLIVWLGLRLDNAIVWIAVIGHQWLQATVGYFLRDATRAARSQIFYVSDEAMQQAAALTYIGLAALVLGLALAGRVLPHGPGSRRGAAPPALSIEKLLQLYIGSYALVAACVFIPTYIPELKQPLLALSNLKWVVYLLFASQCLLQRRRYGLLFLVTAFEFLTALYSFFSSFRVVMLLFAVAFISSPSQSTRMKVVGGSVAAVLAIAFGILWTAVKADYRMDLNRGTGQQVVDVSFSEALSSLRDLLENVDAETFAEAAKAFGHRLGYVEYFGRVLETVPSHRPHEDGAMLLGALEHVAKPRFLFPDKAIIDDTRVVAEYTEIFEYRASMETSISLGWMTETYIDFGVPGMFLEAFFLGMLLGLVNQSFARPGAFMVLGFPAVAAIAFPLHQAELALAELLGSVITNFAMLWGALYFYGGRLLRWIGPAPRREPRAAAVSRDPMPRPIA